MENVLFVIPIDEEHRKQFEQLPGYTFHFMDKKDVRPEDLNGISIVCGNLDPGLLKQCSSLKWVQLESAGMDRYTDLDPRIRLTNASGAYGEAIAEHMLGCVLMFQKNLYGYLKQQETREWNNLGAVGCLSSSTVLCVGMGDIGTTFGRKMHALGSTVYGVRRTVHDKPDFVQALYTPDTMDEILPQCDIVALSLPRTRETDGLFDEKRMRKMKKGSILINCGRGTAIVTNDLIKLTQENWFRGVALDVTDPEPLPKNNVLWNMPNVFITPHISGRYNMRETYESVLKKTIENLKAY